MLLTSQYPFQLQYEMYLKTTELATSTQITYSQTIVNFFNFLTEFNPGFAQDPSVNNIFDRDVSNYLANLQEQQSITNGSYNKLLSQLNHYFNFLFSHDLSTQLPTLNLHGQTKQVNISHSTKWLTMLSEILQDHQIHVYTKMVLLLSSKGYTIQEFMQPGFYQEFNRLSVTDPIEQAFIQGFNSFIKPIQQRQNSRDLFLKQRVNLSQPLLSNAGLHKYLSKDEQYLALDLSPKKLHQSYLLQQLIKLNDQPDSVLMEQLKLDPSSLAYYKHLSQQNL
ncbi:recombinase XerD [Paucilactobacillus nenjiangensis]|uniref:Recombinase XerD n=1 Tax=Paucilactobacillus nenjiangensis TaxID=1296540 RepID=A0A5P1X3G3_9LACO|nr:recombinase XerD [Paucilactobacillus nenjiangensis]